MKAQFAKELGSTRQCDEAVKKCSEHEKIIREEKCHNEPVEEGFEALPSYLFRSNNYNTYLDCQAWVSDQELNFSVACKQYLDLCLMKGIANDQAAEYYNKALINGIISAACPVKDNQLAQLFRCDLAAQHPSYGLL